MNNYSIPLFPLNVVVCPDGLMPLRIFEVRYLDMVKNCIKNKSPFAIVTILPDEQSSSKDNFPFANVGTLVEILDVDVTTIGLMLIRCVGQHRIKVNSFVQQDDGLVIGEVTDISNDIELSIPEDLKNTSNWLMNLLNSLPGQNIKPENMPVIKPYKFEDAAWVANRWVELLDITLLQKQRLMQLDSPILRLEMIHDILDTDLRMEI